MIHLNILRIVRRRELIKTVCTGIKHERNLSIKAASLCIVKILLETGLVALRIRVRLTVLEVAEYR